MNQYPNKILIVTGARQTGKTYLCKKVFNPQTSLNLDLPVDRKQFKAFQKSPSGPPPGTLFVDEIHKMSGWRNLLKGYFDKFPHTRFVVSGSSAFELLRGDRGDSLAGRTFSVRLEPLTFREYLMSFQEGASLPVPIKFDQDLRTQLLNIHKQEESLADLILKKWGLFYRFGGFPEPLSYGEDAFLADWLKEYMNALLSRDLRDLESAKDTERVEQTFLLLLASLGSFYSLRGISEVLLCSPNTVKSDVLALRKLLWGFELSSIQTRINRRMQSAKKFYPVDWALTHYSSDVEEGGRFEGAIASLLHRHLGFENRKRMSPLGFGYFRDYAQKEIDFVVSQGKTLLCGVEAKIKARGDDISAASRLGEQMKLPIIFVVTAEPGVFEVYRERTFIMSADRFAAALW